MAVNKIDPKVIFASEAPAQDTPAIFTNRTVGWGETRKNGGRPTIKQMNAEQQSTDLKILWLNENAVTPYDSTIDYPLNAVTIKDGIFKIFDGSVWGVFLDKTDIGLGNVDNTSDLNKPVSNAVQTALDLKAEKDFVDNALLLQQQINDRGGATWYEKSGGYALNDRVILDNGNVVISTAPNNTNNPNIDMTGWVKVGNSLSVSSISEMIAIPSPFNGMAATLSGVQGGDFVYKSELSGFTDGIIVFNGWARVWNSLNIQPEWAGAVEGQDCTAALQKILDFISPTAFDTSVAEMNKKSGSLVLEIPPTELGYEITNTLYIGAGTKIIGAGKLSFQQRFSSRASRIITNFADPLKPAMSSSNWKTGSVRPAYDEMTTGAQYDDGLISHTPDLDLSGFNICTKDGTRGYIGLRLQNSPRAKVDISCYGFDYGFVVNASWTSNFDCFALSHKCGFLALFDNNNSNTNGYYNAATENTPLVATNLLNFFGPDTDTDVALNEADKTFGFVSRYSYGALSNTITCEGNNCGVAICNGNYVFNSLYTEKSIDYGYVSYSNPTSVIINLHSGAFDEKVYCWGASQKTIVNSYQKDGTPKDKVFAKLSRYFTIAQVPLYLNAYIRGVTYHNDDNVLYVGSNGSDLNNGKLNSEPLLTMDEAFKRITDRFVAGDKEVKSGSYKQKIIITTIGDFPINNAHNIYDDVEISSLGVTPNIVFNGYLKLHESNISIFDCNITKSNVDGDIENSCFWSTDGSNTISIKGGITNIQNGGIVYCDYNGSSNLTLLLNGVDTKGVSTSQLVQGNYTYFSPHIVSVCRSRGSISAAITGRADKGVSVPAAWQGRVLGL